MNSQQLAKTIGDRLQTALKKTGGKQIDGRMDIDINFTPAPLICQPRRIAVNARQIGQAIILTLPMALVDPAGKWTTETTETDVNGFCELLARRLTIPPQPKAKATPQTPNSAPHLAKLC